MKLEDINITIFEKLSPEVQKQLIASNESINTLDAITGTILALSMILGFWFILRNID